MPGAAMTSALVVLSWGYFLYQGVLDPLGGIHSLWPLFGIANQLLAAIALSVATTILVKMHRTKYCWITGIPLLWLLTITFTAAFQKIFSLDPRIGFLSYATQLETILRTGAVHPRVLAETRGLIFNARLDAIICGLFLGLVFTILVDSLRVWARILRGIQETRITEAPFVMSRLSSEEL
jgi:carbon starvation protein